MSRRSLSGRGGSKLRLPPITEMRGEGEDYPMVFLYPQPMNKEDVIRQFFNQIVEMTIEDMVLIPDEEKPSSTPPEAELIKHYKDLEAADLQTSQVLSVKGSKVSLRKRSSRLSARSSKNSQRTSTTSTSLSTSFLDEERSVRITFTTGNTYEGHFARRTMNGPGVYTWSDGTVYRGHFVDGFPTGQGQMTLPDLSHYQGGFNQGLFEEQGFLNIVSTPSFYSGQWKHGMRHGRGWLLYEPGDWYEGEWREDRKHGFGLRHYGNGAKYRGEWRRGLYEGVGTMIWENNDYYKGEWLGGLMHGQGEYIWEAFFNRTFTFPVQNVYRGSWVGGKRCGKGVMHFGGQSGTRLTGTWNQDFKDGEGHMFCGNGTIADSPNLFQCDKPPAPPCNLLTKGNVYSDVPMFSIAEDVDVSHYVAKLLVKLQNVAPEKLEMVKALEVQWIRNVIINFLQQLNDVYRDYAAICAKDVTLDHRPLLLRMFLWQLYRDVEVHKYGLSLVDTDCILAENPKSALDTLHSPFEPIYFWQFLMSLVGVALAKCRLEEEFEEESPDGEGVCASIVKRFFIEVTFGRPSDKSPLVFSYLDLVPIKAIYRLYQKVGEPHSARTFLRQCCPRKGEVPILCHLEFVPRYEGARVGRNLIPLVDYVTFMAGREEEEVLEEEVRHQWSSLMDLRHLGPKNVVRCLTEVCPSIMDEGDVTNIDYPLTFLEFYETLLTCLFLVLDLEMQKEIKIAHQSQEVIQGNKSPSLASRKKPLKTDRKNGKRKK